MKTRTAPVLLACVALLAGSGILRLGLMSGPAFAEKLEVEEAPVPQPGPDVPALIAALQAREAEVAAREAALEERLVALSVAEEAIDRRLSELEAAEASLAATIAEAETANDSDIDALVRVYETMKPDQAIPLFAAMPPEFAAGFIVRMQPESSGPILAGLEPTLAFSISAIIAGRNAQVPTQ